MGIEPIPVSRCMAMAFSPSCHRAIQRATRKEYTMGIEQITCIQVAMAFTPSCYRAIQRAKRKEGNIGIELIPESR